MRAMVLRGTADIHTKPLSVEEMSDPVPEGHDVLIKVEACGVCHSDLNVVEGKVFGGHNLPVVPGHEVVGTVLQAGKKSRVRKGQRVGIGWNYSSCLKCRECRRGMINLCGGGKGATGLTHNGGYADRMLADSRFVTAVPKKLDPVKAAPLFCAGLTAYHAVKRLGARRGDMVAVVGVGGLAEYAIQFLKLSGARVTAFTRSPHHIEVARKLGAEKVVLSQDLSAQVKESGARFAMVFAPSANVLEHTLTGLPRGSKVIMAGNIEKTTQMDYRRALAGEKVLTTTSTGTLDEMEEVLKLAASGKIRTIAEKMPLEKANEAMIRVREGSVEGRIVLVP